MTKKSELKKYILPGLFILFSILRVILGWFSGAWFPADQYWDDALLARYSEIVGHFMFPNISSLLKYMGYPVFLCVVGISHIPYTIWTSLLWLISGYLMFYVAVKISKSSVIGFAAFLYMSFMPEAFEAWCGTRLYRNAIVGPFVAISLLLMMVVFIKLSDIAQRKCGVLLLSVLTGFVTTFTYYIKEDGVWILACLLFAMLMWGIRLICIRKGLQLTAIVKGAVTVIVPLLILICITFAYKAVNYKFLGVFETGTRTSGESGEFLSLVYSIDSPDRTAEIWAPLDAIEKAFAASETLGNKPELLQAIKESPWLDGGIYEYPIHGDFLGWVLVSAGPDSGTWSNDIEKEAFFKQVNSELKSAFKEGKLKKVSGRIVLLPSAGSRTLKEVFDLSDQIASSYKGAVFYDGYKFNIKPYRKEITEETIAATQIMVLRTHLDYLQDYDSVVSTFERTGKLNKGISYVYIIVNVLLICTFVIMIPFVIYRLVKGMKQDKAFLKHEWKSFTCGFMAIVFAGVGFLYAFSIAWFSSFLHVAGVDKSFLNYYNVALPVLLALSYLMTVLCLNGLLLSKGKNSEKA